MPDNAELLSENVLLRQRLDEAMSKIFLLEESKREADAKIIILENQIEMNKSSRTPGEMWMPD